VMAARPFWLQQSYRSSKEAGFDREEVAGRNSSGMLYRPCTTVAQAAV
jgi:hypothetical protein